MFLRSQSLFTVLFPKNAMIYVILFLKPLIYSAASKACALKTMTKPPLLLDGYLNIGDIQIPHDMFIILAVLFTKVNQKSNEPFISD